MCGGGLRTGVERGIEGERAKWGLTAARPGEGAGAQAGRAVFVDLEPDGALAVKGGRRLA